MKLVGTAIYASTLIYKDSKNFYNYRCFLLFLYFFFRHDGTDAQSTCKNLSFFSCWERSKDRKVMLR